MSVTMHASVQLEKATEPALPHDEKLCAMPVAGCA